MFRTSSAHPQELLCRDCICRLWYVVIHVLLDTSSWYRVVGRTLYRLDVLCSTRITARTTVYIYSLYKEAPEDGPMRSETCRAET